MIQIKTNFSRLVLLRMLIFTGALAAGLYFSRDFIREFYFSNQLTQTGIIINSGILVLFFLGLGKIVLTLLRYTREEAVLSKFLKRAKSDDPYPAAGLSHNSIIYNRYEAMRLLYEQRAPINHSAFAATLLASESTRISFARFINNILILSGVFGTIVSLSIALLGASELFESVENVSNMGLVIHGMSAALSTTMTAIVCYVFFGYFFFKLADAQTRLVSSVEQITTYYLMPKFTTSSDFLSQNINDLVMHLQLAAEGLVAAQQTQDELGSRLTEVVDELGVRVLGMSGDIADVKRLLSQGFRLPEREE